MLCGNLQASHVNTSNSMLSGLPPARLGWFAYCQPIVDEIDPATSTDAPGVSCPVIALTQHGRKEGKYRCDRADEQYPMTQLGRPQYDHSITSHR